mgnify:CR=1 FL=1
MRDGKFVFITGADNYNPINEIYNIYLLRSNSAESSKKQQNMGLMGCAALQKSDTKIFALRQASL